MTLQQLEYFLTTARLGSFSAAASERHLAQPSISEQVRRLEAELGVALFTRVGRGLTLTDTGRALVPEAERVLGAVDGAREIVAGVRELRTGTLAFGVFGSSRWYSVAEIIEELRAEHPDLRVRAVGQNSSEVADAVRAGELELGLVVLPIDDRGLDVHPAIRDEVLYASADPARLRHRMTLERLAAAPLVLYDARWGEADPTRRQLAERAQRAGVRLEPVVEVEDVEVALELVARGVGDTILAATIAHHPGERERFGTVSFVDPLYDTFAWVSRHGAARSPAARAIIAAAERVGPLAEDAAFSRG